MLQTRSSGSLPTATSDSLLAPGSNGSAGTWRSVLVVSCHEEWATPANPSSLRHVDTCGTYLPDRITEA
jgi:hypothetical protein